MTIITVYCDSQCGGPLSSVSSDQMRPAFDLWTSVSWYSPLLPNAHKPSCFDDAPSPYFSHIHHVDYYRVLIIDVRPS